MMRLRSGKNCCCGGVPGTSSLTIAPPLASMSARKRPDARPGRRRRRRNRARPIVAIRAPRARRDAPRNRRRAPDRSRSRCRAPRDRRRGAPRRSVRTANPRANRRWRRQARTSAAMFPRTHNTGGGSTIADKRRGIRGIAPRDERDAGASSRAPARPSRVQSTSADRCRGRARCSAISASRMRSGESPACRRSAVRRRQLNGAQRQRDETCLIDVGLSRRM